MLQDRLYLNNGKGLFSNSNNLPEIYSTGSVVISADYDNDGDIDLFVGGRVILAKHPHAPKSCLLTNNNGVFSNTTETQAPELENIGMITNANWFDTDKERDLDLVVTGEWMGIEVLLNNSGKIDKNNAYKSLGISKGW